MLKTHHTMAECCKMCRGLTGGWREGRERGRDNHKVFSMCVVCVHLCAAVHAYVCMLAESEVRVSFLQLLCIVFTFEPRTRRFGQYT